MKKKASPSAFIFMSLVMLAMHAYGCASSEQVPDAGFDTGIPDTGNPDAGDGGYGDASLDSGPDVGPATRISGNIYNFSSGGGFVAGATVEVLDAPHISAQSNSDGHFELDVVRGTEFTLKMQYTGFMESITGTHVATGQKMEDVNFQAPDTAMFDLMTKIADIVPNPGRCQIATTVNPKGDPAHGEPDATVAIDPPLPIRYGPIYFAQVSERVIYPDRSLEKTSKDGGVLFVNVPPGVYTLTAHKEGMEFTNATVRCIPGLIVNAAPPRGLMAK